MSAHSVIWLDGVTTGSLPLPDRGLDFGDGLFETLLLHGGKPLFRELHLERLREGLQALEIAADLARVSDSLDVAVQHITDRKWAWTALRLSVLRGAAQRGYAPQRDAPPRLLVTATRLDRDCGQLAAPANLSVSGIRLAKQPALAGIKHLNRLEQVLAAAQAQRESADESLMLDQAEHLVSVIAGNLFLVRDGQLCTPALRDAGVRGTRRRLVTERWAPQLGLRVREAELTPGDLRGASEVFYSNSLYTVRPVAGVRYGESEQCWTAYPVCEALFNVFREELS